MPELTAVELVELEADMRTGPYLMRPVAHLLDLEHRVLDDLSDLILDGQVDCKVDGTTAMRATTRTLSLTLADPVRQVALDGTSAAAGAAFYDKMIHAAIDFKGPRLDRWVRIPVFTGPIVSATRPGLSASITAQGKERLAGGMVWQTKVYKKGSSKVAAIRDLLEGAGEAPGRIKLPGTDSRLPKDLAIERRDPAWTHVRDLVAGMGRQGMYDARGDFRIRPWPGDAQWLVRDGEGGNIVTDPQVTYDAFDGYNGVRIVGPEKSGKRIVYTAWLPAAHPLSPAARARGGVPFRRALAPEPIKHLRTEAEAKGYAGYYLKRLGREIVKIQVDVLPNWLLEPADVVAIATLGLGRAEQVMNEFTIPLMPGVPMSLGVSRPVGRARPNLPVRNPNRPPRLFNVAHPLRRSR